VKQILQSARTGELALVDVPAPAAGAGQVLVRNCFSVVSPGTEKLAMSFARQSLLGKARGRPDLVKQVLRKLAQEGPLPTYRAVVTRLESPQPLGYSCAGIVEAVGAGAGAFAPGDRVACAGAGYANHAELVVVPENLVCRVPDQVPLEGAAFATLGAIALQGLRVAAPTLGEIAVVVGLGLIGQLAGQLLRANGCRILGIDVDEGRVNQALGHCADWGATPDQDLEPWRVQMAGGHGADLALVTASADTSAPLQLAADLCRLKGRISVIGAMPIDLDRRVLYEKELELRMSTSYGPGRYDRSYEEHGFDYPLPYVRWTENRNLQAFLDLLASGSVRPERLEAEVVPFESATSVYEELAKGERRSLAVVFRYAEDPGRERTLSLAEEPSAPPAKRAPREDLGVAFLGAGSYAKSVLLPALHPQKNTHRVALVTATGSSARRTAEKFGFARCGTDPETVFSDPNVHLIFVATPHDSHAELAAKGLRAGKAIWLEKPVGLTAEEVEEVVAAAEETNGFLAVGYNRRFSPHARAVKEAFTGRQGPLAIRYNVSAGPPPRNSWITEPAVGGGRIIGEVCHFVDLCTYLVGALPQRVSAHALGRGPEIDDSVVVLLGFQDGSAATIEYLAHASPRLPKERFEVSGAACTADCENYKLTRITGRSNLRTMNQDKGQGAAVAAVLESVRTSRPSPFSLEEIRRVSLATIAILEAVRGRCEIELG
jgi:predicted dehydrogenase/threonine dehydrogenase-like Zn-dependent dehydrogenase